MKKFWLGFVILLLLTAPGAAANTVTQGRDFIQVVPDGSTNFNLGDYWANGCYLISIEFSPSAANDILVVRDSSATGVVLTKMTDVLGGGMVKYFYGPQENPVTQGRISQPFINAADCTFGTAANATIIIHGIKR